MLGGAEGLVVPVVQMGEEEEKTVVVPRAEESVVVLWAGAADNGGGTGAETGAGVDVFPPIIYTTELEQ